MCWRVRDDPPEKQSQLGSILQSQSVGAPEITDISPLVDTCQVFKTSHTRLQDAAGDKCSGEDNVQQQPFYMSNLCQQTI